jgi:hypothetical protein
VVGLTWIVERTFAWLARNRRLSKDYELKVQTSEAFIDLAAIRLMLKRLCAEPFPCAVASETFTDKATRFPYF